MPLPLPGCSAIGTRGGNTEGIRQAKAAALATVLSEALRKVPHYRATVGIRPGEITPENAAQGLTAFPYLEKDAVAEDPRAFVNEDYRPERLLANTSTGSTGRGIWIFRTLAEYEIEMAFFRHHWGALGFQPGSRMVRIASESRRLAHEYPMQVIGNRLLVCPYHLTAEWLPQIYDAVCCFRPDAIHAYPSSLERLATFITETGRPPVACRGVLLASESCTMEQCALFSRSFTGTISVNYGLSERTNLAFASYTPGSHKLDYVIEDLYGVTETRPTSDGFSELVGTSYWNRAMPFIRYRTGDLGRIEDDRILITLGRRQHLFVTKLGTAVPGNHVRMESFFWDFMSIAQLVQRRPGALCLRLVPKFSYTREAGDRILKELRRRLGHLFDISMEMVDAIPPGPGGKREFAIVETTASRAPENPRLIPTVADCEVDAR